VKVIGELEHDCCIHPMGCCDIKPNGVEISGSHLGVSSRM
jgi:hypothetical protein